jgi:hypothetical protein
MSALREIALAMESGYDYYYMGTLTKSFPEHLLTFSRILHSFVYQDAIQSLVFSHTYVR